MLLATALALFSSVSFTSALAVIHRDPPSSYGLWSSIGCWGDSPVNRTLHFAAGSSSTNTVESCLDTCHANGFPLGGVEYSSECYCGNSILYNYGIVTQCNMACSGNANEICGGANGINIYQYNNLPYTVGPASAVISYNGYHGYTGSDLYGGLCYQDGSFGVIGSMRYRPVPAIPDEELTVEKCIDGCHANGYNAAGLRYGQQCWCDYPGPHESPIGQTVPLSLCSFPCTGNATEYCGGSWAVLTYYQ